MTATVSASPSPSTRGTRPRDTVYVLVRAAEDEAGLAAAPDAIAAELRKTGTGVLVLESRRDRDPALPAAVNHVIADAGGRVVVLVATPLTMPACLEVAAGLPRHVVGVVGLGTAPSAEAAGSARPLLLADLTADARPAGEIRAACETPGAKSVLWNGMRHGPDLTPRLLAAEIAAYAEEIAQPPGSWRRVVPEVPGTARTARLADGTTLAYTEYGAGDRVIITAQMGFPPEPNYPSLLASAPVNARVLAVTLRGFRPSDTVEHDLGLGWLSRWADDIAELATVLGIERFHYTGGSHGGGVGWYLAERHPHRLDGYIGVVSGPHDRENDTSSSVARRSINDAWPDEAAVRRHVEDLVFGPPTHPRRARRRALLIDGIVADYKEMTPQEARINQGKPWPQAATDAALAAVLRTVEVPTLLLSGVQDVIISADAAFRASSSVPLAKSVLWQDEGHMTWEEAPDRLVGEVALFLDELDATGGTR
ncbi:pimeloyl-ACP methyl ester carboxylesterase [Streptosporangium becharense]|uniref:Pimeloyl-ACP methyl ester carboxylesterase n=1 Tax=Streptosporangium becharense TaxID=1816182 RepID=A0A7W9IAQ9_9ACTN|nr:alpha/beta hydrolase [Streptosporangium becharense]MBB2914058.1 pimeloyl-ACP methyl ester carboxylesterase [Streptosporangium becharense]MBB5817085.1 pimeloyl-ACP methyl ester carboxylesterase [Streptosporangium becharense]